MGEAEPAGAGSAGTAVVAPALERATVAAVAGLAAGADRLPAARRHAGHAVHALRAGPDLPAHPLPLGTMSRGRAGEGVGDLVQQAVAHLVFAVGLDEVLRQLDPLAAEPAQPQSALAAVEAETPCVQAVAVHQPTGELGGGGKVHEKGVQEQVGGRAAGIFNSCTRSG